MDQFLLNTMLDAYDTAAIYNTQKHTVHFIKSSIRKIKIGITITTDQFRQYYPIHKHIHPDDEYLFHTHFSQEAIKKKLREKESGLFFAYREFRNNMYKWVSIYFFIPQNYSENNPEILICQKKLNRQTANTYNAMYLYGQKIYKVVKCNLSDNSYEIIKQLPSEEYIHRKYTKNHQLHEEWLVEESLIHQEDIPIFKHYTDHVFIEEYFSSGDTDLCFFYRRKIGNLFKWVRAVINKATEYTDSNHVYIYILEDIDTKLTRLLERLGKLSQQEVPLIQNAKNSLYYENLMYVLSHFTQKYIDFYMLDLKNDLYFMCKIRPETINGKIPMIGSYSKIAKQFVQNPDITDMNKYAYDISSVETLRKLLKDKTSIEFTFTHKKYHQVKTICTKIESEKGVPTKVIFATMPYNNTELLKVQTFGNFDVFDQEGKRIKFTKKQSKQLLAYLVDQKGFPVSPKDVALDVLEKDPSDLNAIKYVSRLSQLAIQDLAKAGFEDIIIKEWNSLRINVDQIDCDYYHLMNGDSSYLHKYHNEYMKEYSWAEETNAEILHSSYI